MEPSQAPARVRHFLSDYVLSDEQRQKITEHIGLLYQEVWSRHRRRKLGCLSRDEAFSAGALGLIRAAINFRPELGWQFSTYATVAIRRAIHQEIQRQYESRHPREGAPGVVSLYEDDFSAWDVDAQAISPDQGLCLADMRRMAAKLLRTLGPRERMVVECITQHGMQCQALAITLGISRQRVREIYTDAIARMRFYAQRLYPEGI